MKKNALAILWNPISVYANHTFPLQQPAILRCEMRSTCVFATSWIYANNNWLVSDWGIPLLLALGEEIIQVNQHDNSRLQSSSSHEEKCTRDPMESHQRIHKPHFSTSATSNPTLRDEEYLRVWHYFSRLEVVT